MHGTYNLSSDIKEKVLDTKHEYAVTQYRIDMLNLEVLLKKKLKKILYYNMYI